MIIFLVILLFICAFFLGLTLGNAFEFDWQAYFDYKIEREKMATNKAKIIRASRNMAFDELIEEMKTNYPEGDYILRLDLFNIIRYLKSKEGAHDERAS